MALGTEFPYISTGSVYTAIDTYQATTVQPPVQSQPQGAMNPLGAAFLLAPGASEGPSMYYPTIGGSLSSNGWGAPLIIRYVRYNSATAAAMLAYPAPVYWTDETYTTVTGTFSEGNPASTGNINSLAGWLLPNFTSLGKTGAASTTLLNGNFCFIATKGFLPACAVVASVAVGDAVIGASGNFTAARVASGTAPTTRRLAIAQSAVTANTTADLLIDCDITF